MRKLGNILVGDEKLEVGWLLQLTGRFERKDTMGYEGC